MKNILGLILGFIGLFMIIFITIKIAFSCNSALGLLVIGIVFVILSYYLLGEED